MIGWGTAGETLAVVLPALALTSWAFSELIQAQSDASRLMLRETARAYAALVNGTHRSAEAGLQVLAASPLLTRGNITGFRQLATGSLAGKSAVSILFDGHGRQLLNALHPAGSPLPRESFRLALEVVRRKATSISDVEVEAPPPESGTTTIGIQVRRDGAIRCVLAKTLSRHDLSAGLRLGSGMENVFAGVFDGRGLMVRGDGTVPHGVDTAKYFDLTESPRNKKSGTFFFRSERGEKFHAAFVRLDRSDWVVVAAIPVDTLEAPAERARFLTGMCLLATMSLPLLIVMSSRLRLYGRDHSLHGAGKVLQSRDASANSQSGKRDEVMAGDSRPPPLWPRTSTRDHVNCPTKVQVGSKGPRRPEPPNGRGKCQ